MKLYETLIEQVIEGKDPKELVEKISSYDPRYGSNYPYAPVVHQTGENIMDEEGETLEYSPNEVKPTVAPDAHYAQLCKELYNYPLANTKKWPRGSHETRPNPSSHEIENDIYRKTGIKR